MSVLLNSSDFMWRVSETSINKQRLHFRAASVIKANIFFKALSHF